MHDEELTLNFGDGSTKGFIVGQQPRWKTLKHAAFKFVHRSRYKGRRRPGNAWLANRDRPPAAGPGVEIAENTAVNVSQEIACHSRIDAHFMQQCFIRLSHARLFGD